VAGGPLRVVAGLIDRPPLSMIAAPRHRTFGDLRGGRIGTSSLKGSTRHVAERMLAVHGLAYPADFALEARARRPLGWPTSGNATEAGWRILMPHAVARVSKTRRTA
jgi:hypothetical protein